MTAQSIAGTLDLDDRSVVHEAVKKRSGDKGIAQFGVAAISGEDHKKVNAVGGDQ